MGLKVAVHVDLHRTVPDANDDVVPVPLIPVAVCGECTPLAPAAQDLVLDALRRDGQVELFGAGATGCENRSVLAGAAHAIAGKYRASGELGQLGDVVIRQVGGGKLDEGGGGGGESQDLFSGEDGGVLCKGTDLDASSRGEYECGGRKVCAGREALVAVEEDLRSGARRS